MSSRPEKFARYPSEVIAAEPGDAAAQMRAIAEQLAGEGDHAQALCMELQASLVVHAMRIAHLEDEATRKRLIAVARSGGAGKVPSAITTAYLSAAMHIIGNLGRVDPTVVEAMQETAERTLAQFMERARSHRRDAR